MKKSLELPFCYMRDLKAKPIGKLGDWIITSEGLYGYVLQAEQLEKPAIPQAADNIWNQVIWFPIVTLAKAAELLKCEENHIEEEIKSGNLKSYSMEDAYAINSQSVLEYATTKGISLERISASLNEIEQFEKAGLIEKYSLPLEEATFIKEMTVQEAAEILGYEKQKVITEIEREEIGARKIGETYLVSVESVKDYAAQRDISLEGALITPLGWKINVEL